MIPFVCLIWYVQGSANPQTPGSENKRIKSCVLLPATGRRAQLFHLIFSKPGVCGFADPCIISRVQNDIKIQHLEKAFCYGNITYNYYSYIAGFHMRKADNVTNVSRFCTAFRKENVFISCIICPRTDVEMGSKCLPALLPSSSHLRYSISRIQLNVALCHD